MGNDPAVLFYTSDFLTGTMTMTNENVGKYIRLLCLQHQKGRLTEQDMLFICTTYVEDVYKKFEKDKSGLYYNKRMEEETIRRKRYSDSRRDNIKKRYEKQKDSSTYVVHMENENENENKDKTKSFDFEKIWNRYPKKDGKKAAFRHFKVSVKTDDDWNNINKALDNYMNSENYKKGFIKNGSTWFNNWQDWIDWQEPDQQEKRIILDE